MATPPAVFIVFILALLSLQTCCPPPTDPQEFKTLPAPAAVSEAVMEKLPISYDRDNTGRERRYSEHLSRKAQRLAERMATTGYLEHSDLTELVDDGFGVCAENVCFANDWYGAYSEWRHSTQHYQNMKGHFKYAGFGVAQAASGGRFFCVIYAENDPFWQDGF